MEKKSSHYHFNRHRPFSHISGSLVKGGVIRSIPDSRDYHAEAIIHMERLAGSPSSPFQKSLPDEDFLFDPPPADPSKLEIGGNGVYNQGPTYKCVAYVGCTMRERQVYDEYIRAGKKPEEAKRRFSEDYIYDLRSNTSSDGMSGADLMRILIAYGVVEQGDYDEYLSLYSQISNLERKSRQNRSAEDDEKIHDLQTRLSELQYRFKNEGPGSNGRDLWARVTTVNGIKESIHFNRVPLLAIFPFYGSTDTMEFWKRPVGNESDEMGHSCAIVGYSNKEEAFYVRNTWGPDWNGTGHFWFKYRDVPILWEMFTLFPRGTEHLLYHKKRENYYADLDKNNQLFAGAGIGIAAGAGLNNLSKLLLSGEEEVEDEEKEVEEKKEEKKKDSDEDKEKKEIKRLKKKLQSKVIKLIDEHKDEIKKFSKVVKNNPSLLKIFNLIFSS